MLSDQLIGGSGWLCHLPGILRTLIIGSLSWPDSLCDVVILQAIVFLDIIEYSIIWTRSCR